MIYKDKTQSHDQEKTTDASGITTTDIPRLSNLFLPRDTNNEQYPPYMDLTIKLRDWVPTEVIVHPE